MFLIYSMFWCSDCKRICRRFKYTTDVKIMLYDMNNQVIYWFSYFSNIYSLKIFTTTSEWKTRYHATRDCGNLIAPLEENPANERDCNVTKCMKVKKVVFYQCLNLMFQTNTCDGTICRNFKFFCFTFQFCSLYFWNTFFFQTRFSHFPKWWTSLLSVCYLSFNTKRGNSLWQPFHIRYTKTIWSLRCVFDHRHF